VVFLARCRTVLGVVKGFFWRVWWKLEKDEAPKHCDFLRLWNMLLKATFPSSYLGLVEATWAATKKWLAIRIARYIFMSAKNMLSSQYYIIYSPPFGWPAPPTKRCEYHQAKTGFVSWVLGKLPLIAGASRTICTRFISRAALLCPNLDGTLCPTLRPLPFNHSGNRKIFLLKQTFGIPVSI